MVTLESPSREQEERLLAAAREAGQLFDELYEAAPVEYRQLSTAETFDTIVEKHLDGYILERYILNPDNPLPESMSCLEEAIGQPPSVAGFVLDGLVRILVSCGKDELVSYRLVWEAFNRGCFVRVGTPRDMEQESVDLDWRTEGLT
jgi:hypothetical protein